MKQLVSSLLLLVCAGVSLAQQYQPTAENVKNREGFQDAKFGMFIHWGASSVLGHGEWVMNNRNIHVSEYKMLQDVFYPSQFDAKEWVAAAKNAGMKYITFITRHHDGFSNWDTRQSDWKITKTQYGKDVTKMLAEECHRQGIKIFFYYSLLDWYRTDYQYSTGRTGKGTGRTEKGKWEDYVAFMKAQLTELLTQYGEVSGIWFDGHWDQLDNDHDKSQKSKVDWQYQEIYELIHKLQPGCLISNNHHLTPLPGEDFQAFEKDLPGRNTTGFGGAEVSKALPLETCETMNDSWGFNITDRNYKSVPVLIRYMVNAAGRNANFLLNVGPRPDGKIQQQFVDTLKAVGKWMDKFGHTIYNTRGGSISPQPWGVTTENAKSIYVHILNPEGNTIFLPDVKSKVLKAKNVASARDVKFKQIPEGVFLYIDKADINSIDTIIELDKQTAVKRG